MCKTNYWIKNIFSYFAICVACNILSSPTLGLIKMAIEGRSRVNVDTEQSQWIVLLAVSMFWGRIKRY